MAEVVRIEPSKFCEGEAWFIMSDGNQYLRKIKREQNESRSDFPAPAIRKDTIDPIRSMANGKMYDSLSGLYASYKADGNPQGVNYQVVGDDTKSLETFTPPVRDDAAAHAVIERVLQENGI